MRLAGAQARLPQPRSARPAVAEPGGAPAPPTAPIADVAPLAAYTPGTSYFGTSDYVEYIAGDLPVIFSAPHGGALEPAGIPARTTATCGPDVTTVTDANTEDLVRQIRADADAARDYFAAAAAA